MFVIYSYVTSNTMDAPAEKKTKSSEALDELELPKELSHLDAKIVELIMNEV